MILNKSVNFGFSFFKLNSKKAMTAKTLVSLILLIIGFVIILLVWTSINLGSESLKQVCHQSIIFRSSLPNVAQDYVPLNCETDKICIGKNCPVFEKDEQVSYFKPDSILELESFLANEIFSCWSMTGEGKLSIFSKDVLSDTLGLDEVHSFCLICSRISFDKEYLKKEKINLDEINLAFYMKNNKISGKDITYEEAFQGNSEDRLNLENFNQGIADIEYERVPFTESLDGEKELSILFSQVSIPTLDKSLEGMSKFLAVGIAGGSFFTGAGSMVKVVGGLAKSPAALAVLAAFGMYAIYSVEENLAFVNSYCGELSSTEKGGRRGCSVVRTATYDAASLQQYCTVIESKM